MALMIGFMLPLAAASKAAGLHWTVVLLPTSVILRASFIVVENQYACIE